VIARTIPTTTHGRYLVQPPTASRLNAPLLVGFHGYAEAAEPMHARLTAIPGAENWSVVSVLGLNRFYQRRTDAVIAGWMTRQDRELAIADNIAYVGAVVDAIAHESGEPVALVYAGFSQGVATAFRAGASTTRRVSAVIAAGGDVPPEIPDVALRRCGRVLLCRGSSDEWYTPDKFSGDIERLRRAEVDLTPVDFQGGHEWSDAVVAAAGSLLRELVR
jgi:predicted esterase